MRERVLAGATLVTTFLLLIAGGLVHATGSALACPDWPLCYGDAFPKMAGGVFYEHGHRLTAGTVALLTLVLALRLLRRWHGRERRWGVTALLLLLLQAAALARAGMLASAGKGFVSASVLESPALWIAGATGAAVAVLVIALGLWRRAGDNLPALGLLGAQLVQFQASLGGLTVLLRLPTAVSTAHLATAMLYAALLLLLVVRLAPAGGPTPRALPRRQVGIALGVVFSQLLLGALVRHTGSALACNVDLLVCDGGWPHTGPAWLNFAHRLGAVLTAAILVWAVWPHARAKAPEPRVTPLARAVLGLVGLQIGLGLWTVGSFVSVGLATAHLAVGALLFVVLWGLFLALAPVAPAARTSAPALGVPPSMAEAPSRL